MPYTKKQRELAVKIATERGSIAGSIEVIRAALESPQLGEKTVQRWMKTEDQRPLNDQQKAFVLYYTQCWNATKAAKAAGYSEASAHSQGYDLLRNPEIQAEIQRHLDNLVMSSAEVLTRMSMEARSDIGDFIGLTQEEVKNHPNSWLIKKYKFIDKPDEKRIEIEMYDAQAARVNLAKHYGLFVERHEHTGVGGKPIEFRQVEELSDDDLERIIADDQ